ESRAGSGSTGLPGRATSSARQWRVVHSSNEPAVRRAHKRWQRGRLPPRRRRGPSRRRTAGKRNVSLECSFSVGGQVWLQRSDEGVERPPVAVEEHGEHVVARRDEDTADLVT